MQRLRLAHALIPAPTSCLRATPNDLACCGRRLLYGRASLIERNLPLAFALELANTKIVLSQAP